jgi:hypothetical protein
MLCVLIHQEVLHAHVKKAALEIHSVDVWISMNALLWINHVEHTRFVRIPNLDSNAFVLRDIRRSPMLKLHVKDLRFPFSVIVIMIAQTMQNVSKVNASVRKGLKLLVQLVLT